MTENFYTENIGYEPKLNFDDYKNVFIEISNGSPEVVNDIEAIRQWILKFIFTDKNTLEIYEGTGFGNRIRRLFGQKIVGYGYEEAEIERDFREGLPLCPAITNVTDFELTKEGKTLNVKIEVELYNGELVDVNIEKIYKIR